jgi:hypothetical protein
LFLFFFLSYKLAGSRLRFWCVSGCLCSKIFGYSWGFLSRQKQKEHKIWNTSIMDRHATRGASAGGVLWEFVFILVDI